MIKTTQKAVSGILENLIMAVIPGSNYLGNFMEGSGLMTSVPMTTGATVAFGLAWLGIESLKDQSDSKELYGKIDKITNVLTCKFQDADAQLQQQIDVGLFDNEQDHKRFIELLIKLRGRIAELESDLCDRKLSEVQMKERVEKLMQDNAGLVEEMCNIRESAIDQFANFSKEFKQLINDGFDRLNTKVDDVQKGINRSFIENIITKSTKLYANSLVNLSDIFITGIGIHVRSGKLFEEYFKQHNCTHLDDDFFCGDTMHSDIATEIGQDMRVLLGHLEELKKNLSEISKDSFCLKCFIKSASKLDSALVQIYKFCIEHLDEEKREIDVRDLGTVKSLIEIYIKNIKKKNMLRLLSDATLLANVNKNCDNMNARSFFFVGNLLEVISNKKKDGRCIIYNSLGAAILHDLFRAIPNENIIRECLTELYHEEWNKLGVFDVHFIPEDIVSSIFLQAIIYIEERKDMYTGVFSC
jgi:hypothetical protein